MTSRNVGRGGDFLREIRIVIAPPDTQGLAGLPEFGEVYAGAEGAALPQGLEPGGPPTLVIASDSILKWNLGAVHELLHLVHHAQLDDAQITTIDQASPDPQRCEPPLLPCNPFELFAYTGQWYLSGYGEDLLGLVATEHRATLETMFEQTLGACRTEHGHSGLDDANTRALIAEVVATYGFGE